MGQAKRVRYDGQDVVMAFQSMRWPSEARFEVPEAYNVEDLRALAKMLFRVIDNQGRLEHSSVTWERAIASKDGGHSSEWKDLPSKHPLSCLKAIEAQIDVIGGLQKSLIDVLRQYRVEWSTKGYCGIYTMPVEVLSTIFEMSLPAEGSVEEICFGRIRLPRLKRALAIAGVSWRFREVAHNTPVLWSTIYAELRVPLLDAVLSRTRKTTLDVYAGSGHNYEDFLHQVFACAEQWGSLSLTHSGADHANRFLDALRSAEAPCRRLGILSLNISGSPQDATLLHTMRMLQHLIRRKPMPGASGFINYSSPQKNTQAMLHRDQPRIRTCLYFMGRLALCRGLQALRIVARSSKQLAAIQVPSLNSQADIYPFPSLRRLSVELNGGIVLRGFPQFIGTIRAPKLRNLWLAVVPPGPWLANMAVSLYSANGTFREMRRLGIHHTVESNHTPLEIAIAEVIQGQPHVRAQRFPDLFFRMMPSLGALTITGDALEPPYTNELCNQRIRDCTGSDFPPLKRLTFTSMPGLDVSYLLALIELLNKRSATGRSAYVVVGR